jgi:hypothetical protein
LCAAELTGKSGRSEVLKLIRLEAERPRAK